MVGWCISLVVEQVDPQVMAGISDTSQTFISIGV